MTRIFVYYVGMRSLYTNLYVYTVVSPFNQEKIVRITVNLNTGTLKILKFNCFMCIYIYIYIYIGWLALWHVNPCRIILC